MRGRPTHPYGDPGRVAWWAGGALLVLCTPMVLYLPPLFVVGALAAIAGTVFFFARPALTLLGYFGFRILADMLWWLPISVGGLSVLEVLSGGITGLAAILFYLELSKVERHPAFGPLAVYLAAMVLSAGRSLDIRAVLSILAEYTSPFLIMFLVTALFRTPASWRRVMGTMTVVGFLPILVSLFYLVTGQMSAIVHAGYNRLLGGYANLHTHAHMMALFAILCSFWVFYLYKVKVWNGWRLLFLGAAGSAVLCLLLSYVRTPLVGLGLFVIIFPFLERRYGLLVAALTGALLVGIASDTVRERFAEMLIAFEEDDVTSDAMRAGSGRLGIWTVSLREFARQSPIDWMLGLGLGGHWLMVQPYLDKYRPVREGTLNPHNDYLGLLYQLGPFAVGSYLWMQALTIYYAWKLHLYGRDPFIQTYGRFMVGLMFISVVTNFMSNSFVERVTPAMILWVCAGLVFSMHRYVLEQAARERLEGGAAPRGLRHV